GAAVMAVMWITLAILRRASAPLRYTIAGASLVLLVVTSIITFFVVRSPASGNIADAKTNSSITRPFSAVPVQFVATTDDTSRQQIVPPQAGATQSSIASAH